MLRQFDAVIVGAGPAGAAAAILLSEAGWSVALIERQAFPRRKVCGECVAASNLPLLASLGIGPAFDAAAGAPLREVAWLRADRSVSAALPPAAHSDYPWGRALGRETLDRLLRDRAAAAGATVLQPMRVQGIEGAVGAWRVAVQAANCAATRTLLAGVAILANGSWEALSGAPSSRRRRRTDADLFAFKANFRGTSLREGVVPVIALDGGYGGMVIADGATATLACCVRRDRLRALRRSARGMQAGAVIEAWLQRECGGVRDALRDATRVDSWLSSGPLDPGVRIGIRDGVFRIGNAAAEAHPIIGEGISMALQSASLLCAQLIAGRKTSTQPAAMWQRAVQRGYEAQWRSQFMPRLRLAALFASVAMRPTLSAAMMSVVKRWPRLLTLAARRAGKVQAPATASGDAAMPPFPSARSCIVTAGIARNP